jgi:Fe-S cluster assembly protein SufD
MSTPVLAHYNSALNKANLPLHASILAIRENAKSQWIQSGFPSKSQESWKYVNLTSFLSQRFSLASEHALSGGELSITEALSDSALALSTFNSLSQSTDYDGFVAYNTASFDKGYFLQVAEGQKINTPIRWQFKPTVANEAHMIRHLIIVESGAHLTLVEDFDGENQPTWANIVTEIILKPNATMTHFHVQHGGDLQYHTSTTTVSLAQNAVYQSHCINLSQGLSRHQLHVALKEEGATCLLNGVYVSTEKAITDYHTTIHHQASNGKSEQDYKGIATHQSTAIFNGQVIVDEGTHKNQAAQQNKNLLLSRHATINAKPELQIYADDVSCSHGATVGQLDNDALFYLQARGFTPQQAQAYLMQAFAAQNLSRIENKDIATWLQGLFELHWQKVTA